MVHYFISLKVTSPLFPTLERNSVWHQNLRDLVSHSCFDGPAALLRSVRFAVRSVCIGWPCSRSPGRTCLLSIRSALPYVRQSLEHLMVPIHVRFATLLLQARLQKRNRTCRPARKRSTSFASHA